MRVLVSMTIVLLTMALPAASWSAPPAQTPEPLQRPPVSGDLADDVAVQEQGCGQAEPCEGEAEPGLLGSVFGRFLNPCECGPHWYFTADAVALQRSNARSQLLFRQVSSTDGVLDARDMNFPTALGFQVNALRQGPCGGWEWELGYFQIDGFDTTTTIPGAAVLRIGAEDPGLLVHNAEAHYRSAIHLAEINLRRQWCDGLTLLVGFRAGELNEFYSGAGLERNEDFVSSLNINTYNHLYGFQTGGIYEFYNMGGPLRVSAMCKAGIYGNSAIQSSTVVSDTGEGTLAAHRNQAAFMGEVGTVATYQVTCHLSFRASCQAMWIEGVALAPEQVNMNDFNLPPASIDTHGGIFYYGGGLGMELKF
jgi:hypothetical protein